MLYLFIAGSNYQIGIYLLDAIFMRKPILMEKYSNIFTIPWQPYKKQLKYVRSTMQLFFDLAQKKSTCKKISFMCQAKIKV